MPPETELGRYAKEHGWDAARVSRLQKTDPPTAVVALMAMAWAVHRDGTGDHDDARAFVNLAIRVMKGE